MQLILLVKCRKILLTNNKQVKSYFGSHFWSNPYFSKVEIGLVHDTETEKKRIQFFYVLQFFFHCVIFSAKKEVNETM